MGDRLHTRGLEHRGIYLQWPGERHHLDFVDLTGRSVWVYGQTELTKDLGQARDAGGQQACYGVSGTAVHDLTTGRPSVTFTRSDGSDVRLDADVIAGCDGALGPSRAAVPAGVKRAWERTYPYSWLGILADVAPSTDELIYAWHPDGFALHSMRSPSVSASTSRSPRAPASVTGRMTGSGQSWPSGSGTARAAGSSPQARSPTRACCRCAAT